MDLLTGSDAASLPEIVEEVPRLYQALRLQASAGAEGIIRLSGIFVPDVYLPGVLQDPPADPSKPVPKVSEGTSMVVSLDSYPQVR